MNKLNFYSFVFVFMLLFINDIAAQVNIQVRVLSGSASTTCRDSWWLGNGRFPKWDFEVAGQGRTTYPRSGICVIGFENAPYTQYNRDFDCVNQLPSQLNICFGAFHDGLNACRANVQCRESTCQNFAVPAIGTTTTHTMSVGGASSGTVTFEIRVTGAFNLPGGANDVICDAIDLGTLASGATVGNSSLSNYGNYCAGNTGDPNAWGNTNDQGVWFKFTTSAFPSAVTYIEAQNDPQGRGDGIDLQLAIFESRNNLCTGVLTKLQEEQDGLGILWDEDMDVQCLKPNTTYYILVDGEGNFFTNDGQEGFFGIQVRDDGILQAGDEICDAEALGTVPSGGSVSTPNLSRSNVCASSINDPNPGSFATDQTVWFSFQAPPSGHVIVNADSDLPAPFGKDAVDLQLACYGTSTGTCTGTLEFQGADYTPGLFGEELEIRCLTPGETYWVMVDGSPLNVDGIFDLTIRDGGIFPASNDKICDAIPLGQPAPGGTVGLNNQNNYCADNIFEPIPANWGNDQGVWYTFVAPPSGKVEVRLNDKGLFSADQMDLQVAVYDSDDMTCTGVLTELKSEHEGIGLLFDEDMEVECLIPGRTYYILVDGEGTILDPDLQVGIFDIEVYGDPRDPPAPYDDVCNALALGDPTGGSVQTTAGPVHPSQNNFCASATGEPQPNNFTADQTVWYTFVAPSTGNVNIEIISDAVFGGTDAINLQVAVYESLSGTCTGPWREELSGDDLVVYDINRDLYCLNPGQVYYVQVDGAPPTILEGHEGYFDIKITELPPIPVAVNDLICDAIPLGNPFTAPISVNNQHNLCADNIGDPTPSEFGPDKTVWYTFTTPATGGPYAVDVNATSALPWPFSNSDAIDLQLAVFSSSNDSCTGSLTEVKSEYDPIIFNEQVTVACLEPNRTYFLMVDGSWLDPQGYFDLTINPSTPVPVPVNDLICDHVDLGTVPISGSLNNNVDYSNFCADTEPGEPRPFGIDQTVWFSFIAPIHGGLYATSEVTVRVKNDPNNVGDQVDLQLAVYESSDGTCNGNLSLLEDGSDDPLFSFNADVSVTCLKPGQRYFVQVDGSIIDTDGYFTIEVEDDGAGQHPPYDSLCQSEALGQVPAGGSINNGINYQNLCAGTEPGEPNPNAFGLEQTVWFTFQAPASGNVTIDLRSDPNNLGDDIDLQMAVYYSSNNVCTGSFIEVDSKHNPFGNDETMTLECLVPGQTYFLQVDGASGGLLGGEEGYFTVEIEDDGGTTNFPYNNDICNAYNFGVPGTRQTLNNENNECANVQFGEPGVGGYATHTVWYQFTAPPSGRVEFEVTSGNLFLGMDPEVYLFSSDNNACTGNFSREESSTWPTALISENIEATCLIPGNTYFIQVDGSGTNLEGDFDIWIEDMYPQYGTGGPADPQPSNNNCANAIPLTVQPESCINGSGTFQQMNYGVPTITYNPAFAQNCNNNCGDTWYSFTMPSSGLATIEGNDDNIGSGLIGDFSDLTVVAYTGTCNSLTPIDCDAGGLTSDVSYQVTAAPGTTVWVQVFNDDGDDDTENYEICVSEACGADDCLAALAAPMVPNIPYCFNTSGANGEDVIGGAPGYKECSSGDNPDNSVYYSFVSDCNGGSVTISVIDAVSNGNCIAGTIPDDGFNISLFQDATPCDDNPDALVDCQSFTSCDVQPINWSNTYTNLVPNTPYVIQIDGGSAFSGGNNSGEIMITVTTNPTAIPVAVDESCSGAGDGSATVVVNGGVPPFTFLWSNGSIDSVNTNLTAGTYTVTVTSINSCTDTATVVVNTPNPIFANINNIQGVNCVNACDGSATVVGSGGAGSGGFTYLWDVAAGSQTTATATNLCPGSYSVSVFDAGNCYDSVVVVIPNPDTIKAEVIATTDAACSGICNGTATVGATGGTVAFDYTYLWPNGSNLPTVSNLCAGSYLVTISDDNGCQDTIRVVINEPISVVASVLNQVNVSCNGDADGAVGINAVNGTPGYTYTLYNSTGQLVNNTTGNFTGLAADSFGVLVADQNGCSDSISFVIVEPATLTTSLVSSMDVSCFGGNDGELVVSADVGTGTAPYEYSLDGINFTSSGTFSSLVAGNYTVTVRDSNNCIVTIPVPITEPTAITVSLVSQTQAACGVCDGTATVSASGGAGTYTYLWPSGSTTANGINLCSGTNTVTITDASNCTATFDVNILNSANFAARKDTVQGISCAGACDAIITATATAGQAPYTYVWSTGQTTDTLFNLCAGIYTLTLTDDNGCFVVETFTITDPDTLNALAAELQAVSCNGLADAQAIATAIGGTAPYSYVWDNGETTATATVLDAGIHTVTITDAALCTTTATVDITQPQALTSTISNIQSSSCTPGLCDGAAQVTVSGGQAPYSYSWSSGSTSPTPTDLCQNFNYVTITDNAGCSIVDTVNIPVNSTLSLFVLVEDSTTCYTACDGRAIVSASGGNTTAPYTFTWNDPMNQTTAQATNLCAGTYQVTVEDASGCTVAETVVIGRPDSLSIIAAVNTNFNGFGVSCFGSTDAQITTVVAGGSPSYTYSWSSTSSASTLSNIGAGTYTVTLTDAKGCTDTASVVVTSPAEILTTANVTSDYNGSDISCTGALDGSAVVSVVGATGVVSYNWSNAANTDSITGIGAGTYTVTVTDANNCSSEDTVVLLDPAVLTLSLSVDSLVSCAGANDGVLCSAVSGGTGGYSYAWSTGDTTDCINGLAAGTYTLTVADTNNCTATATIILVDPAVLTTVLNKNQDVSCFGGNDASVVANPAGGTMPYTYLWSNGEITPTATSLAAGMAVVTITDANGCTVNDSVLITEPSLLTVSSTTDSVSCFGKNDGNLTLTVTGGTLPYSYTWGHSSTTSPNLVNVGAGAYEVTVTDGRGCSFVHRDTIHSPTTLDVTYSIISDYNGAQISCADANDGVAVLQVTGGSAPFTYQWINGQNTDTVSNLQASNYPVTVTDASGCQDTVTVSLTAPAAIDITTTITSNYNGYNVTCRNSNDGAATVVATGGTGNLTYTWSGGQTGQNTSNLGGGTYEISVVDDNGCLVLDTVTLTMPDALVATSSVIQHIGCHGQQNGAATVTVTGGVPNYQFFWSNNSITPTVNGLSVGQHTVTITDAAGCQTTSSVTIIEPRPLEVSATVQQVSCYGDSSGSISLNIMGGTAPYQYTWGHTTANVDSLGNLAPGTYTVTVTDSNNCFAVYATTINQPTPFTASAGVISWYNGSDVSCYGATDGEALVNAMGGLAPYTYLWSNGETTRTASNLPAGTQTVTITDSRGCQAIGTVVLTEPNLISTNVNVTSSYNGYDVSCPTANDGVGRVIVAGGTAPYTYLWSNGSTRAIETSLGAGTYTVTVTDKNNCSTTTTVTLTAPAAISLTTQLVDSVQCNGQSNGVATVNNINAIAPFSYTWSNGEQGDTAFALSTGIHQVSITDANGCTAVETLTMFEPTALVGSINYMDSVSCFGGSDGVLEVVASGATPVYTYLWSDGQTTTQANNLVAGIHRVTITDSKGCTVVLEDTMYQAPAINISFDSIVGVACANDSDGQAIAQASGGAQPYNYIWSSGETTAKAVNLNYGYNTVTVTDAKNCSNVDSVFIPNPNGIQIEQSSSNLSCYASQDGWIQLNVGGGTAPYTYTWSNGATTSRLDSLSAGTYTCVVTDANNCQSTLLTFTLTEPSEIVGRFIQVNDVDCYQGTNGMISLEATGGSPAYDFEWSNGFNTFNRLLSTKDKLSAGQYSITITDRNNCSVILDTIITQPGSLDAIVISNMTTCQGNADGSFSVTASGGQAPYLYSVNGSPYTSDSLYENLSSGSYQVSVMDANLCVYKTVATVSSPDSVILQVPDDMTIRFGETVDLSVFLPVNSPFTPQIKWTPSEGLSCDTCYRLTAQPLVSTTYTVEVVGDENCPVTADVHIEVGEREDVFIPNAFSPNDDRVNDKFIIYGGIGVEEVEQMYVFDRWGELVYEANNIQPSLSAYGWDGTFKGKMMNTGVFVYYVRVRYIDGTTKLFKGDVTLVR